MQPAHRSAAGACLAAAPLLMAASLAVAAQAEPWPAEKAKAWSREKPWLVGCNFVPSTAINQLEMWQPETFDPVAIDRELKLAHDLGFTSVRVFLHDIPWKQDRDGFVERVDQFLKLADKYDIGVMFVLFDSVWHPHPAAGKQPEPTPGVHNSGWMQSPGAAALADPSREEELRDYVTGIVGRFRDDDRVHVWDVWNEPDNTNASSYGAQEPPNKDALVLPLLRKTFEWAREAGPEQPLTSGVWAGDWSDANKLTPLQTVQVEQSDVVSFHSYGNLEDVKRCVGNLRRYDRPILCTEYMARPLGSTFDPVLGWFAENDIGAYNWGFVEGRSQTIFPWDSWQKPYEGEPPVWFHDIFRADGTPYRPDEVGYIRTVTAEARKARAGGPDLTTDPAHRDRKAAEAPR